jgi:hypothetical protein
MRALVTDADLARAHKDPAFRRDLVAGNLDFLLMELNRLRNLGPDARRARLIREGVDLAVKLADVLQRAEADRSGSPRRGEGRQTLPFHRNAV